MIPRAIFDAAVAAKELVEKIIAAFMKEQAEAFQERFKRFESGAEPFKDEDLIYSAETLCPCGHGIAYPKGCGGFHHWDCSAILKGIADRSVQHTGQLPFTFYEVKSEQQPSANGATTRGVFRPKPIAAPSTTGA